MEYFKTLDNIVNVLLAINVILYVIGFTRQGKAYRLFTFYLAVIFSIQMVMKYIANVLGENNLFLSHFYFVLQFILLLLFYKTLLKNKLLNYILIGVLFLLGLQYALEPGLYTRFNPVGIVGTQLILVFIAMTYLYRAISQKLPFVIVSVGVLIYLLCNSLVFGAGNLTFSPDFTTETLTVLWNLNIILFLGYQVLISVEWLKNYNLFRT